MTWIISSLSTALLATLLAYVTLLVMRVVRESLGSKRREHLEEQVFRQRIDQIMDKRRFEMEKNELSWNGFRKFEVVRKVAENRDINTFYLAPHDGKPLPPFLPGQYLTFELHPEGGAAAGKPVVRCYSLSDSPNYPDRYRVSIKRVPPPRDKPDAPPGLISNYFHDRIKEGDILNVKAPSGHFTLDMTQQSPIVLIGGGIGVTPVLSMVNAIAESGSKRQAWFFFGVRNSAEHIMKDHLREIAAQHENINVHVCYSDPDEKDQQGSDYAHAERVSVDLMKRLLPSNNFEFYICGPPPLMNQVTKDLKEWGVPSSKIYFEAFGPATVKKVALPQPEDAAAKEAPALEVTFAKSNKTVRWSSGAGSLLELAEANGITIDAGCRAGNCGTCLTAVKRGEVHTVVDSGAKPEAGSCLTCISVPKTAVTLDA
ncbi:MAG: 2Fe-2S iron-sulfur cluster-binding protein [Candidatus Omnitrophota bacterium]|nr:2Fe-2S iron-sulfur cluster-binding protein [Candidatus Omnitrophota bacterium]